MASINDALDAVVGMLQQRTGGTRAQAIGYLVDTLEHWRRTEIKRLQSEDRSQCSD